MSIELQILWLFVLAIPIACIAWTITHEALFREVQEYCRTQSDTGTTIWRRKFFYLLTCEYCVSHYVTVVFLAVTRFHLLYQDWRGYLVSLFALVWVANQYMSIYNRLRLDIKHEHIEIKAQEQRVKSSEQGIRDIKSA